jgi:toxin ParE1/3/4
VIVLEIRRTDRTDEDLIEIWTSIAKYSPTSADHTLDAIEQRWRQSTRFRYSGRAREDIAPGVRCVVVGQ